MKEELARWWKKAKRDLDNAKYNLKGKRYEETAFFSQQAAEKAIKALLIKKSGKLIKTHDLVLLSKEVGLPKELEEFCKKLTPAYIYTRYPDVIEVDEIKPLSEVLIGYAEEILKWIEKKL